MNAKASYVVPLDQLNVHDVPKVGGKNASLGEMLSSLAEEGVRVPEGFATTAEAFRYFVRENNIEERLKKELDDKKSGKKRLSQVGKAIRSLFLKGEFPEDLADAIREAYAELCGKYGGEEVDVAVRSSATAEDLPDASFAGQQETFLNVTGEEELMDSCRRCYASLFTDRAISYREDKGFDHLEVALSIGVQKMVRSDKAGSGVMFSIDTETGFPNSVVINAAWGLGENVVQGAVTPDEYRVFKPLLDKGVSPIIEKVLGAKEKKLVYATGGTKSTKNTETTQRERNQYVLSDEEILQLSRWAMTIENHYERPMDIEWAKDGDTGDLFIVQARPETVQSGHTKEMKLKTYNLKEKGQVLITGVSVGQAVASGKVQIIESAEEIETFEPGSVLVTGMTDPDWVPIMKQAAAIVTDRGGRTCHAAIVSRELGIPAVVGTGGGTHELTPGEAVTVSCAEGDVGKVYQGELDFEERELSLDDVPRTETRIYMNAANPDGAMRWWRLPVDGIGLARMEFIITNVVRVHPLALTRFDQVEDRKARREIEKLTQAYEDKSEYFVDKLARGIAKISASRHPGPVILRMSDFKTNEYADLIGGRGFEPVENNPMIGFRGASRYVSDDYKDGFTLECEAVKRVRNGMGFTNLKIMIPFCRTLEEADAVLDVLAENGLKRGENGLEIYVMAEIPSNVLLADGFSQRFDGFSIGSNDLTQLVLGVDRDSSQLSSIFDERNDAVKRAISQLIKTAHEYGVKVGICGQAPSDYPEFAEFLVMEGIDSISLNPDSVLEVVRHVAEAEKRR